MESLKENSRTFILRYWSTWTRVENSRLPDLIGGPKIPCQIGLWLLYGCLGNETYEIYVGFFLGMEVSREIPRHKKTTCFQMTRSCRCPAGGPSYLFHERIPPSTVDLVVQGLAELVMNSHEGQGSHCKELMNVSSFSTLLEPYRIGQTIRQR